MAVIFVYPRVTKSLIREFADNLLKQVPEFFADNPDRVDCVLEFHYRKFIKVTRDDFREAIEAAAAECIKENHKE